MRMRGFRVRTLMLAVGVAALLVWGTMIGTRAYIYYRLATYYGDQERGWREIAARDRVIPGRARTVGVVWGPKVAEYYAPLARKYRRAMWRPDKPWPPILPHPVFGSLLKLRDTTARSGWRNRTRAAKSIAKHSVRSGKPRSPRPVDC